MFSATTLGAQYLLPISLLAWLAVGADRSRAAWAIRTALVGLYLIAATIAGLWPMHPWIVAGLFAVALLLASIRALRRAPTGATWPMTRRSSVALAARGAAYGVIAALAAYAMSGWKARRPRRRSSSRSRSRAGPTTSRMVEVSDSSTHT